MSYTFETIGNGILFNGDCLEVMPELINQGIKVDAIITDVPYGTTACKWDNVIPFEPMWKCLNGLIKENGAIALFGCEPFSSHLRLSNEKMYKYDWKWNKEVCGSFVLAKKRPMVVIEDIILFSKKGTVNYYPIMEEAKTQNIRPVNKGSKSSESNPVASGIAKSDNNYNPKKRYPKNIITYSKYNAECNNTNRVHPTQKPVELMEYLIKTYTNENELVLDFTMGSGSTGVACKNLNRKFIGIELDKGYYEIAKQRIKDLPI